jgi:hypothetical protein
MWNTQITSKQIIGDKLRINVNYFNGTQEFDQEYFFAADNTNDIDRVIGRKLRQLNEVSSLLAKVSEGEFTPKEIAEPVVVEDKDREKFIKTLADHQRYLRAIELGVIDINDSDYTANLNKLKTQYKKAFLELF